MARKSLYEGVSFDELCRSYLTEGNDLSALTADTTTTDDIDADEFDDEIDADDADLGDDDVVMDDTEDAESDVTVTLSADLVAALRSIIALVDSQEGDIKVSDDDTELVDVSDDELEADDDVLPADQEVPEEAEEDEEVTIGAPRRRAGAPAINRRGTGDGEFSRVSSRRAEAAELSDAAPRRVRNVPSINRAGTNTSFRAKIGTRALDINR